MTSIITDELKRQVERVIQHSQGYSEGTPVNAEDLLQEWYKGKKYFIDDWKGELIYEVPEPVQFELSPEEKRNRLSEFIDAVALTYGNDKLADFLDYNFNWFFSNHLEKDYYLTGTDKIPKGTKIIKAFKHFEEDPKILDKLQTQASMIIQEDKINGKLCFSVHPLDYLSSSENTYHWRSCHSLDGDYRGGNLSYMMDSSTIVCYLRNGSETVKLPRFPEDVLWNSKKWRMLMFMSDGWDALFAGRQYPFYSPTALDIVKEKLLASFGKHSVTWTPWYNEFITTFPGTREFHKDLQHRNVMLRGKMYDMFDLVEDGANTMHFNDLLNSSTYIPFYCWDNDYWKRKEAKSIHFSIGKAAPCPCCNGRLITSSPLLRCDDCEYDFGEDNSEYFGYCDCCESRCYRDDMVYVNGLDGYVCPECLAKETLECESCTGIWYTCDITYDRDRKKYICPTCREYFNQEGNENKEVRERFSIDLSDWLTDLGISF